jgi:hypothetical protein
MMRTQEEQIEQRCQQMPDIHLANYKRAMRGKSMKAAIKAFCLECVQWQREEVRLCTDLACCSFSAESKRSSQEDNHAR